MSASFLTYAIALPAKTSAPSFHAGAETLAQITDISEFTFGGDDAPEELIRDTLDLDFDTEIFDENGQLILAYAADFCQAAITCLEDLWDDAEIAYHCVGGYRLHIAGGMSFGDDPSPAYTAISNIWLLPTSVLRAMGFILDFTEPLSRKCGNTGPVTDTDVIDAIALGLGTQSDWNGGDCLEWISTVIAQVRPNPGELAPAKYLQAWSAKYDFDPQQDNFLNNYVDEEATCDTGDVCDHSAEQA